MRAPEPVVQGSNIETRPSSGETVREQVRTLNPDYFALVMATGMVAIAAHLTGMQAVGR